MFDLENLEAGTPITLKGNLLLIRPLAPYQISMIKQYFSNIANNSHWCGYAFLDNVPNVLARTIMCDANANGIGVVLFSETPEQVRFIFRDINDTFRLLNADGYTIFMTEHLEAVLERFVNRPVC